MDEERERGRIAGHRTKRLQAVDRSRALLTVLQELNRDVGTGSALSLQAIALWMTAHPDRHSLKVPVDRKTVDRALKIDHAFSLATDEFKTELAIVAFKRRHPDRYPAQRELDHLRTIHAALVERDQAIEAAWSLKRQLHDAVHRWSDDLSDDLHEWRADAAKERAVIVIKIEREERRSIGRPNKS